MKENTGDGTECVLCFSILTVNNHIAEAKVAESSESCFDKSSP